MSPFAHAIAVNSSDRSDPHGLCGGRGSPPTFPNVSAVACPMVTFLPTGGSGSSSPTLPIGSPFPVMLGGATVGHWSWVNASCLTYSIDASGAGFAAAFLAGGGDCSGADSDVTLLVSIAATDAAHLGFCPLDLTTGGSGKGFSGAAIGSGDNGIERNEDEAQQRAAFGGAAAGAGPNGLVLAQLSLHLRADAADDYYGSTTTTATTTAATAAPTLSNETGAAAAAAAQRMALLSDHSFRLLKGFAFFELQTLPIAARRRCAHRRIQNIFGVGSSSSGNVSGSASAVANGGDFDFSEEDTYYRLVAPFAFWNTPVGGLVGTSVVLGAVGLLFLIAALTLWAPKAAGSGGDAADGVDGDDADDTDNSDIEMLIVEGFGDSGSGATAVAAAAANGREGDEAVVVADDGGGAGGDFSVTRSHGGQRLSIGGEANTPAAKYLELPSIQMPTARGADAEVEEARSPPHGVAVGGRGRADASRVLRALPQEGPQTTPAATTAVGTSSSPFGRPAALFMALSRCYFGLWALLVTAVLPGLLSSAAEMLASDSATTGGEEEEEEASGDVAASIIGAVVVVAAAVFFFLVPLLFAAFVSQGRLVPQRSGGGLVQWLFSPTVAVCPKAVPRVVGPFALFASSSPLGSMLPLLVPIVVGIAVGAAVKPVSPPQPLSSSSGAGVPALGGGLYPLPDGAQCIALFWSMAAFFALLAIGSALLRPFLTRAEAALNAILFVLAASEMGIMAVLSSDSYREAANAEMANALVGIWFAHAFFVLVCRIVFPIYLVLRGLPRAFAASPAAVAVVLASRAAANSSSSASPSPLSQLGAGRNGVTVVTAEGGGGDSGGAVVRVASDRRPNASRAGAANTTNIINSNTISSGGVVDADGEKKKGGQYDAIDEEGPSYEEDLRAAGVASVFVCWYPSTLGLLPAPPVIVGGLLRGREGGADGDDFAGGGVIVDNRAAAAAAVAAGEAEGPDGGEAEAAAAAAERRAKRKAKMAAKAAKEKKRSKSKAEKSRPSGQAATEADDGGVDTPSVPRVASDTAASALASGGDGINNNNADKTIPTAHDEAQQLIALSEEVTPFESLEGPAAAADGGDGATDDASTPPDVAAAEADAVVVPSAITLTTVPTPPIASGSPFAGAFPRGWGGEGDDGTSDGGGTDNDGYALADGEEEGAVSEAADQQPSRRVSEVDEDEDDDDDVGNTTDFWGAIRSKKQSTAADDDAGAFSSSSSSSGAAYPPTRVRPIGGAADGDRADSGSDEAADRSVGDGSDHDDDGGRAEDFGESEQGYF